MMSSTLPPGVPHSGLTVPGADKDPVAVPGRGIGSYAAQTAGGYLPLLSPFVLSACASVVG